MIEKKMTYITKVIETPAKYVVIDKVKEIVLPKFKYLGLYETFNYSWENDNFGFIKTTDNNIYLNLYPRGLRAVFTYGLFCFANHYSISFQEDLVDKKVIERINSSFVCSDNFIKIPNELSDDFILFLFYDMITPISKEFVKQNLQLVQNKSLQLDLEENKDTSKRSKKDYRILNLVRYPQRYLAELELMLRKKDNWYCYKDLKLICAHEWDLYHKIDTWTVNNKYSIGGNCKICGEKLTQLDEINIYNKNDYVQIYNLIDQDISEKKKTVIIHAMSELINSVFPNGKVNDNILLTYIYIIFNIVNTNLPSSMKFGTHNLNLNVQESDIQDFQIEYEDTIINHPATRVIINTLLFQEERVLRFYYHPIFYDILKVKNSLPQGYSIYQYLKTTEFENDPLLKYWHDMIVRDDYSYRTRDIKRDTNENFNYIIKYNNKGFSPTFVMLVKHNENVKYNVCDIVLPYFCPYGEFVHTFDKKGVCSQCGLKRDLSNLEQISKTINKLIFKFNYSNNNIEVNNDIIKRDEKFFKSQVKGEETDSKYMNINNKTDLLEHVFHTKFTTEEAFSNLLSYAISHDYLTQEDIELYAICEINKQIFAHNVDDEMSEINENEADMME